MFFDILYRKNFDFIAILELIFHETIIRHSLKVLIQMPKNTIERTVFAEFKGKTTVKISCSKDFQYAKLE